jgi:tricorn protease
MVTSMFLPLLLQTASTTDAFLRMPDIHGDRVVFTCEGDLWIGNRGSGNATRLTRDAGVERYAKFSPDGKQIAYSAQYDGIEEVYVISAEGGAPRRLSYRHDYAWVLGWSADGSKVLFRTRGIPRSFSLYTVGLEGGPETKLNVEFASHADMAPDGVSFAWTRFNRSMDAWFSYKGGMQNQIWVGNTASGASQRITNIAGTNEFPSVGGNHVYFVNENQSQFQLMRTPVSGGKAESLGAKSEFEIREVSSGPGGVVFEQGLGISLFDPATKQVSPVKFNLTSDKLHTKPYSMSAEPLVTAMTITPSGKRVLVEARGQIVSAPAGAGEARLWKSVPGARLRNAVMSPDSKRVAYMSDERMRTGPGPRW